MEKLIELLNQYGKERIKKHGGNERDTWRIRSGNLYWEFWDNTWCYMVIISKEYGFIKRLVENNKIDKDKIIEKSEYLIEYRGNKIDQNMFENGLLMDLSIQDNPIEFLVSILK